MKYYHYMVWIVACRKKEIGLDYKNAPSRFPFPSIVLKLIPTFVPQNVKGELWPDA